MSGNYLSTYTIKEIAKISVGRDLVEESFSKEATSVHKYPVYSNSVENKGLYGFYNFEEYSANSLTVVGRGAGLGTAFPRSEGFGAIGRLLVLTPKKDSFDVRYLSDYINNKLIIFNESGGIPQLPGESLAKYKVKLPPLPEQKAIADLLSTWDEAIEKTERLIQAKEKRFQLQLSEIISIIEEDNSTEFVELGKILSYEQPTKYIVESSDYVEDGKTPVLTANKSFILGYTNEEIGIYTDLPVIIFDDFTTDSKFVDFSFKVKSSALKILKPASNVDVLLVYWLVTRINAPVGGHKRHWISEYQYNEILLPELSQQKKFSKMLEYAQKEINLLKKLADKYKTQKRGLMQKLLTGEWRVKPEIVNQYMEA